MSNDIKVAAALMGYSFSDQQTIMKHVREGSKPEGKRLEKGYDNVLAVKDLKEGYAGFPVERTAIDKNKSDDRNVGRVVQAGGTQLLVTGRKADGRYTVINKDGSKTAKSPEDLNLIVKEKFDLDSYFDWNSSDLDEYSFEDLEEMAEEILSELNEEGLLEEALEAIDGICLLNEAPGFEHIATGAPRKKESPKPAPKPQVSRKEKVKAAVKSAASTAGRAVGTAAGKAVNTGEKVGSAVKSAAKGAGKTVKKVARGAGEVAGSAAGGFAAGYKAARNAKYDTKKDTGAKQRPSKPSTWGNKSSDNKSPVSDKGVASRKSNKPNTYDKVKSGLKKAIGAGARAVARGARGVARRMSEGYSWREHISVEVGK